ncbi:MAG TPA: hypothetical protein VKB62_15030, partial [Streptosporangiaceae bacterium]|nr:hypothetical protein [Streptosporangiaceae bacterium]
MSAVSAESPRGSADLTKSSDNSAEAAAGPSSNGSPGRADFGPNQWLVDELYQRYQADPGSVDQAWWSFFADYQPQPDAAGPPAPQATAPAGPTQASTAQASTAQAGTATTVPGGNAQVTPSAARPGAAAGAAAPPASDGAGAAATVAPSGNGSAAAPTSGYSNAAGPISPGPISADTAPAATASASAISATPPAPVPAPVTTGPVTTGPGTAAAVPAAPPSGAAAEHTERLRGAAARTAANMTASLTVPTATSVRPVPAKLLVDNRIVINNHLARGRGGKISFTH